MITLVLADDHTMVRQGLCALLAAEPDCCVIGEAADGRTALQLVEERQPDVLVVDLMMPLLSGLEVTRRVRSLATPPYVVVLSMHVDEIYVLDALRSGAAAYVLKENDTIHLLTAIRAVVAGQRYLSPPLSEQAINQYLQQVHATPLDAFALLTNREREIFQLIAEGHTNPAIADLLQISTRTVETHRANLMRKLELHSPVDLIRFAMQRDLLVNAVRLTEPDHQ